MVMLEDLKPGKFKGVEFLFKSSKLSGGRKQQKHEYPNSNRQKIEDFGLLPKSFDMTIFIAAPNYFEKRDALIRVFDEGGPGVLSHPFYGDIPNMVARPYSISEDLTELGEAIINVKFDIDNTDGVAVANVNVIGNIQTSRKTLSESIESNISSNFSVDNKFLNNFKQAKLKLLSLNDKVRKETSFIFKIQEGANDFNALLSDFGNNVNELITKPANLASSIISIFDSIDSLYVNVKDSFDVYKKFSNFGNDDIQLNITTAGLNQRQKNNNIINSSIKAISLGYQYQNAAKVEYETVEEIEAVESVIEDNYQAVINSEGLSDDMVSNLKDLRSLTSRFFKNEKLTADKVTEIRVNNLPARIVSYQYYADSSIGERIINLNQINDVSFIDGNIRVFTE